MTAFASTLSDSPALVSEQAVSVPDTLADDLLSGFPSAALVQASASQFRQFKSLGSGAGRGWSRAVDDGVRWHIEVGPGVIRIGSKAWRDAAQPDSLLSDVCYETATAEMGRAESVAVGALGAVAVARDTFVLDRDKLDTSLLADADRRRILGWSRKSRARMILRLAELDYAPMTAGGRSLVMLTLTLPAPWWEPAPTGKAFKRRVDAWRKRYEATFGEGFAGVWKLEFQRRGAPHLHIECAPPTLAPLGWHGACAMGCTVARHRFADWLSWSWALVCQPKGGYVAPFAVGHVFASHVRAGTGLDYALGHRSSDPKRLAIYFGKHGTFEGKEYQHNMPPMWAEDGAGRFWGYWRLERAVQGVELAVDSKVLAARTLRRWSRQQHRAARGQVPQYVWKRRWVSDDDGVVQSRRRSKRRVSRLPGGRGFIIVNDGPALAQQLARAITPTVPGRLNPSRLP